MVARSEKLKMWGVGPSMCKGRMFAERELVSLSAAVISLWDVSPTTRDGEWKIPAMRHGTGVRKPAGDLRVVVRRRVRLWVVAICRGIVGGSNGFLERKVGPAFRVLQRWLWTLIVFFGQVGDCGHGTES